MENSSTIENLLTFSKYYTISTSCITFILGFIGNLLNILTFTKVKIFRNNQCIFYLIVESIVDLVAVIYYFIIRLLSFQYGSDLSSYSTIWCKIKTIIVQTILLLLLCIISCSAFDQFLSTSYSVFLRQKSTLKLARRLVIISICFSLSHSIGFGVFFYAKPPIDCVLSSPILIHYYSYVFYPIISGFLPILISGSFSILAYRNVRRIIRRQLPIFRRRLDQQLTKFILARVIFVILFVTPFVLYRAYIINTNVSAKDSLGLAIENLLLAIIGSILNLIFAVKFLFF